MDEIIQISHEISDFLSNLKNKNYLCLGIVQSNVPINA